MEILKHKVPKHIFQQLEAKEIYSLDYFLMKSKQEICENTRLSNRDVENLINIVSKIILNRNFVTGFELKENVTWKVLYTGCPVIDKTLNGIPTRGITEIYGESGSGKTQFGLQLALQVQKLETHGGLNAGAIYICTEDSFPSKRLQQLSEFVPKSWKENQEKSFLDDIFIEHIQDIEQLKYCIAIRVPVLLSKTNVKLIVIDSIAAIFRYDNAIGDYISRSEDLRLLATKLNALSLHYNLTVVCINQVMCDIKGSENTSKPCLGLSWSNLIRKRIRIHRCNSSLTYKNHIYPKRTLHVIYSPETAQNECSFIITTSGLNGL